jgi:cell division protein FtsI (penicillin-binding protein 3)
MEALYAAANDLPSDDPLRAGPGQTGTPSQTAAQQAADAKAKSGGAQAASTVHQAPPLASQQGMTQPQTRAVMVIDPKTLRVPSLIGLPVRKVIELAGAAGLEVQVSGSGTVREQAPAPGTMVAPGTQIVVRCGR